MTLRGRVMVITLCLCLVFGGLLAGVLQVRAFRANLDAALKAGLDTSQMLAGSLTAGLTAFSAAGDPEAAPRAVRVTAQYMTDRALVAVVDQQGTLLYDNFADGYADLFSLMPQADGQYAIHTFHGTPYQLIRRGLMAEAQTYTLYFAQDLGRVYQNARQQASQAGWVLAGLCAAAALGLLFSLRASFQPLNRLERAALHIAQGDWAARVPGPIGQDEVGRVSQAFNVMADATQQHIAALTRRDQAQKQFIADMAHELKSPLTSMIGYADLLRRSKVSEEQRQRALDAIVHQGERLERMGFKLLRLARLDGEQPPDMAECPVSALLQDAAEAVEGQRAEKDITIVRSEDGASIRCERDLMAAMLQNLLQNALKASRPGSRVWLTGGAQGFTVRDEGEGIAKEHLLHVFEAFYMADKSRARNQQGAGLGLALCQRVAQLHGMRLSINSEPGVGTEVTATFTT